MNLYVREKKKYLCRKCKEVETTDQICDKCREKLDDYKEYISEVEIDIEQRARENKQFNFKKAERDYKALQERMGKREQGEKEERTSRILPKKQGRLFTKIEDIQRFATAKIKRI